MSDAIAIIYAVVRNVHLKRALHAAPGNNEKQNFWRMMMGNSMDMAVIDWCKLFGSDDEDHQPVDWKNQVLDAEHDKFRAGLLDAVGLSKDEWRDYWEKTKAYRDQHAAHFDATYLEDDPKYPDLTVALESAYFYYAWIDRAFEALRCA